MSLALETSDLTVSVGGFALQHVDLRVPSGALCAVLGAPGSGKSLLLKLLLGLEDPDTGQRRIFGREFSTEKPPIRLGYLPQSIFLDETLTVQAALRFTTLLSGESHLDDETMKALLATVNLAVNPNTSISLLNTAQRRRLLLAKVLVGQPEIVLLDEPAAPLRGEDRQEFLRILRDAAVGRTLVYTTSVPSDARDSDWLAILRGGSLVVQGPSADLFENADYAEYSLTIRGNSKTVHELLVKMG